MSHIQYKNKYHIMPLWFYYIYISYIRLILKKLVPMAIKTILSQDQGHQLIVFEERKKLT